jgi:hypothetical protein
VGVGAIFIIMLVGGGIVGASLYFSRGARLKRTLRNAPRLSIKDVSEREPAKIVGTLAYLGESLISPLTGRSCAYYEIHVEQYESGANDDGHWRTIIRESLGQDFMLEDGTGRAIINPVGAQLALTIDSHSKSGSFDDPTDLERNYLISHGQEGKGWVFNKRIRYREGILEADESVAVLGRGVKEPDPDGVDQAGGYRSAPPMRLRMRGSQKTPLLISDDTGTLG